MPRLAPRARAATRLRPARVADQAEFGKDRPQGVDLAGIAAVERGQGEQRASDHGRTRRGKQDLRKSERVALAAGSRRYCSGRLRRSGAGRSMAQDDGGFRIEHDSMGELRVPADALWGAQTQRAVQNFPIQRRPMPRGFIRALGLIKAAAAEVNAGLGLLTEAQAACAIRKAALAVAAGDARRALSRSTCSRRARARSSNMNANEVIATPRVAAAAASRCIRTITSTSARAATTSSRPAIHVSRAARGRRATAAGARAPAQDHRAKRPIARPHHQDRPHAPDGRDAADVRRRNSAPGRAQIAVRAGAHRGRAAARLRRLPHGGTAIGTGINADPRFRQGAWRRRCRR